MECPASAYSELYENPKQQHLKKNNNDKDKEKKEKKTGRIQIKYEMSRVF